MRLLEAILSILAWIGISLWTALLTLPIALVYLVHPLVDPDLKLTHGLASIWGRGLVSLAPGSTVYVTGQEHLPRGRPVILMANHQSYVDVPVLYFLKRQFKWMADEPLFRIPFFGWSMQMAGYIPVRRGDSKFGLRSLEQARAWLTRGIPILIFPEGTRSHTGVLGRFQTGGFRLAAQTRTPIVPVVVIGTRQLLPRGSWIFRLGVKLQLRVLPPVVPSDSGLREVRQLAVKVRSEMKRAYRQGIQEYRAGRLKS